MYDTFWFAGCAGGVEDVDGVAWREGSECHWGGFVAGKVSYVSFAVNGVEV